MQKLSINVKKSRNIILLITSILTGVITAFSGPIVFYRFGSSSYCKNDFYNI